MKIKNETEVLVSKDFMLLNAFAIDLLIRRINDLTGIHPQSVINLVSREAKQKLSVFTQEEKQKMITCIMSRVPKA